MAVVIDASALVTALVGRSQPARRLRHRLLHETCHAPHLIDAEVGNVLRRRVLRNELSPHDADLLLHAGSSMIDHRHEMTGKLAGAAWTMRENLSFYDALYVALAGALEAPLLTADNRLAQAPRLGCRVEPLPIE